MKNGYARTSTINSTAGEQLDLFEDDDLAYLDITDPVAAILMAHAAGMSTIRDKDGRLYVSPPEGTAYLMALMDGSAIAGTASEFLPNWETAIRTKMF